MAARTPWAQPGGTLGSGAALGLAAEAQRSRASDHSQEKQGGEKETTALVEHGERRLEKHSVHHLKDPTNRNTEPGCKQSNFYSD